MLRCFLVCGFALSLLVGCGAPSASESASVDTAASNDAAAPITSADVTEPEQSGWLQLPEGIPESLAESYEEFVKDADGGGVAALANLASVSQQIGSQTMEAGDEELGLAFIAQSGKALRKAMNQGLEGLPSSFVGSMFYNEACAHALSGRLEQAELALKDAVEGGFGDYELLETDADLDALRNKSGFADKLEAWKAVAAERTKAEAAEHLHAGETFPFVLSAEDINGETQSLESLKGKVVILDVWGTWCPPCRAEIPSFIKLQEKLGPSGFQMLGLNYERLGSDEENLAAVKEFVVEQGINYPCIMGEDEVREQIPNFQGYPTTLFIDKAGKVRMKAVGLHDYAYLEAVVQLLLAE